MKFSRALVLTTAFSSLLLSSAAFAQDAEDDGTAEMTFEQKIIHQFMTGLGASNGIGGGIKYRERSPLVLPPQMTLPQPQTASRNAAPANWPKDPDEAQRKAMAASPPVSYEESRRQLTPTELAKGRTSAKSRVPNDTYPQPGQDPSRSLRPDELGYKGGVFSTLWGAGKAEESAKFTGEPDRNTLTEPPPGYQTPSPNFAYGVGQAYKQKATAIDGQDPARGSGQ
jgi:hypothetical protein